MLPTVTAEFRVAAAPELRFAPSGVAVCNLRAVASSRKKDESGNWVDDKNCWVTITGFKQLAENMAESFDKGDLIVVDGKIYTDEWEDTEGNKRVSVRVNADRIGMSVAFDPARSAKAERSSRPAPSRGGDIAQVQQEPQSDEPPF